MNAEWIEWHDQIASHCESRWETIAPAICNDERINTITRVNVTCPECGKAEKLYIVDKFTYSAHCCSAKCNAHYFNGVALIAELNDERVTDTLRKIENYLGLGSKPKSKVLKFQPRTPVNTIRSSSSNAQDENVLKERQFLLKTLESAQDTLVTKYLLNRGIDLVKLPLEAIKALSFHPKLRYFARLVENDEIVGDEKGEYPAMVAKVFNSEQTLVGFHKTYLSPDGAKANVTKAKQLTKAAYKKAYSEKGAFIPLVKPTDGRYGLAEGIETALAIVAMKRPCWSVISAAGIKNFVIPKDCKVLDLYGDLDVSGTGQAAIIKKYYDVQQLRPDVKVNLYLPPEQFWDVSSHPKGIDFLDVYLISPSVLPPVFEEIE